MYIYVLQAQLKCSFALFTIQYRTFELILQFAQSFISNWFGEILIWTIFFFKLSYVGIVFGMMTCRPGIRSSRNLQYKEIK
jgi:hypothetical protein